MTVIDLGRVDHEGDDPPAGSRPGLWRRPGWRRWLVAVVTVGCVLTVTGSARPEPRGLVQLWEVPFTLEANSYQATGDDVFVFDRAGARPLTARDARTGAVRWSIPNGDFTGPADAGAGVLLVRAGATVVNLMDPGGSVYSRELSRDTVAVEASTGRQLWRQTGEVVTLVGAAALLVEWGESGDRARRIRLVRLSDGGTVWSRDSTAVTWAVDTTPGARPDRLLTVTAQGRAEVLVPADGSVVTTGTLLSPGPIGPEDYSSVAIEGRRLYQDRTVNGRTTVSAYDLDTLRWVWRVQQSPGGSFGCGPVVCTIDGDSISGHDRATGSRLWRLPGLSGLYPLTGDRLLAEDGQNRLTVVAARTGQLLAELGRGRPVWDAQGRPSRLIAGTRQPPGRTAVSSLDPTTGEVVLRGTVPPAQNCRADRDLLICVTEDNRLTVTRIG